MSSFNRVRPLLRTFARSLLLAAALLWVAPNITPAALAAQTSKSTSAHKASVKKKTGRKSVRRVYRPAQAAILVDANSGTVLYEDNADTPLHPASLTKMMTLYLTFEAIDRHELSLYQNIPVSAYAAARPPSGIGLRRGDSIRVRDAIMSVITRSANDAATVLGEAIGGTESAFAAKMTAKARALGMAHTTFLNASGLHNPQQYSSARDMAILSQALIQDFPQYYPWFSTESYVWNGHELANHNHLMSSYPGMDGLKTGYISQSGFNLAASAKRGDKRLIAVVFGGPTASARNARVADLLDTGFEQRGAPVQTAKLKSPPPNIPVVDLTQNQQALAPTPAPAQAPDEASLLAQTLAGGWSIQIGAFGREDLGQKAIEAARQKIPNLLGSAQANIVPVRTKRGTLYRARLAGLDQKTAAKACNLLDDCLQIAPQ